MKKFIAIWPSLALIVLTSIAGSATDLLISLPGSKPIVRKVLRYQCDSNGARIGLPAAPFPVEYINGSGNNLVTVPLYGSLLIFSNVASASGARYVAQQYTWWESGGSATLYFDSLDGRQQCVCKPVVSK